MASGLLTMTHACWPWLPVNGHLSYQSVNSFWLPVIDTSLNVRWDWTLACYFSDCRLSFLCWDTVNIGSHHTLSHVKLVKIQFLDTVMITAINWNKHFALHWPDLSIPSTHRNLSKALTKQTNPSRHFYKNYHCTLIKLHSRHHLPHYSTSPGSSLAWAQPQNSPNRWAFPLDYPSEMARDQCPNLCLHLAMTVIAMATAYLLQLVAKAIKDIHCCSCQ